mgnify:FL=1
MPTFREQLHSGDKVPLVETDDLAPASVTHDKLANECVAENNIMDGAVTTPKIADRAVTAPKIAAGAVTKDKIDQSVWDALVVSLIKNTGATAIGPDGCWWVDGVCTYIKARGDKGEDGKDADVWTIGEDGFWYLNGEKTEFLSKGADGADGENGADGKDGITPMLRISTDGMSLEISYDQGETWELFNRDFNKLRVIGYVDSVGELPINAYLGDIYGVWNATANEGEGAYELYINTVKRWDKEKDIDRVYEYDSELPASAADGTVVLIPVTNEPEPVDGSENESTTEWQDGDEALDKKRVDGYKVYKYSVAVRSWLMILNTAEIYAAATDIVNHGDNVYALVQGATAADSYQLYKRVVDWQYFGTNASITYHLVQNIEEGTATNILSGEVVKQANTIINNKIQLIASGVKVTLSASPSVIYKNTATTITLTGRMEKASPTEMKILDGATELAVGASSPVSATPSLNTNENSKSYQVKGVVQGVTFDSDVTVQARNKIYYGFAANAAALAVDANKYAATTSAAHTYTRTNGANGQHFYILVPNDITDVNSFTMGGAPFVMNTNTQTIGGISYSVHESGNVYNAGTEVSVVASN